MLRKEKRILLDEQVEGGGSFATDFTDEDTDDFDLSGLGDDKKSEESDEQAPTETEKKKSEEEKKPEEKEEEEKKEPEAESGEEEKESDEKESDEGAKEAQEEELETLRQELKDEGKSDEEIEKAIKDKQDEFEKSDDDIVNPFETIDDEVNVDTTDEDKPKIVDYNYLAKELELEVEEGKEIKSEDDFKDAYKKNLEKARTEVNLDDYPPEVKLLMENFKKNNNLHVTDFYKNDTIQKLDAFQSLPKERKIKAILAEELRSSTPKEDLHEAVEDRFIEMTDDEVDEKIKTVDRNITKTKTNEYNKIIKEKNSFFEKQEEKEKADRLKERENLASKFDKMEKFLGFPIPDKQKKIFANEIKTGKFEKFIDENVEDAKIYAYLGTRIGKNIEKAYENMLAVTKTEAYQKGLETKKKQKHNIKTGGSHAGSKGRQSSDLTFDDSLFQED